MFLTTVSLILTIKSVISSVNNVQDFFSKAPRNLAKGAAFGEILSKKVQDIYSKNEDHSKHNIS